MTRTKYFTRELRERFAERDRMTQGGLTTLFAMLFILAVALIAGCRRNFTPIQYGLSQNDSIIAKCDTILRKQDSILKELSHH